MTMNAALGNTSINLIFLWDHSVNLGTDPSWENYSPASFSVPLEMKNLTSFPKQTKSPGNSNMLRIINNNTYTDFRTASKHVLIIPSAMLFEWFNRTKISQN